MSVRKLISVPYFTYPGTNDSTPTTLYTPLRGKVYTIPGSGVVYVDNAIGSDSNDGLTIGAPKLTIAAAVSAASTGNTIVIRGAQTGYTGSGRYRITATIAPGGSKALTFQNYNGEDVTIDGRAIVSGPWTVSGSTWWADFTSAHRPSTDTSVDDAAGTNNANYPTSANCIYALPVSMDGAMKTGVSSVGNVVAGTFFHDYTNNRLYVGDDPTGKVVEAAVAMNLMTITTAASTVRGIVFVGNASEYANATADGALVVAASTSATVENCTFGFTCSFGVYASASSVTSYTFTDCDFIWCGSLGFSSGNSDMAGVVIKRCRFYKCNALYKYRHDWAMGGIKILGAIGAKMVDCQAISCRGAGFWYDFTNYQCVMVGCYAEDCSFAGFDDEMNRQTTIVSCTAYNCFSGILVQGSAEGIYTNNTLYDCARYFRFINDSRTVVGDPNSVTGDWGTPTFFQNNACVWSGAVIGVNGATAPAKFIDSDDFDNATSFSTAFAATAANCDYNLWVKPGTFSSSDHAFGIEGGGAITNYDTTAAMQAGTIFADNDVFSTAAADTFLVDPTNYDFRLIPGVVAVGVVQTTAVRDLIGPRSALSSTVAPSRGALRGAPAPLINPRTMLMTWTGADSATVFGTLDSGQTGTAHVGNHGIATNKGYSSSDANLDYWSAPAAAHDGAFGITIEGTLNNASTFRIPRFTFRGIDTSNFLQFIMQQGNVYLHKMDAGVSTQLATAGSVTTSDGVQYKIKVICIGTAIRCFVDGTLVLSHTLAAANAKYLVGNRVGYLWSKGGAPATAARVDNLWVVRG